MLPLGLMPMCVCNNDHSDVFVPFTLSIPREPEPQGDIKGLIYFTVDLEVSG